MRPWSLKLARTYDATRLVEELRSLGHLERVRPGPYATDGWDGIALIQADGRADSTRSPAPSRAGAQKTFALASCPYLEALLDDLPAPTLVARLLYLAPGGFAGLHRDPVGLPIGTVRLHVPIVTHPDVELWIAGERQRWAAGELWYGDFTFPHRLANPSPITRVHLVLDICVTEALLALFPEEALPALGGEGLYTLPARSAVAPADLPRFARRLAFRHADIPGLELPATVDVVLEEGELVARGPGGELVFVLDPVDAQSLRIRGYHPGVTFEWLPDGDVELVHRGRVMFPEGMSPDDVRTPWNLVTTRWSVTSSGAASAEST